MSYALARRSWFLIALVAGCFRDTPAAARANAAPPVTPPSTALRTAVPSVSIISASEWAAENPVDAVIEHREYYC